MRWRRAGTRNRANCRRSVRPDWPMMARSRARDRRALLPFHSSRDLDPERGHINPDDFSSKWMITPIATRRTLAKIDQPVAYLTSRNRTPKYMLLPGQARGRATQTTLFWKLHDDAKYHEEDVCPGRSFLLLITVLLVPNLAYAADQDRVQFCWAMGEHDHTIYFAEIENREDRQASFDALLEISGIDHHAVKCSTADSATHRLARAVLFNNWRESEFEIVNTTFLLDLDY